MSVTYTQAEFDEAYEIGVREGYERAVQEIDMKTGGDGEYRYCTDRDPERHTPGPAEMIQRIVDRFETLNLIEAAEKRGDFWDAPEPKPCGIADPSTRDCPNMKEVGGGFDGERYRCAVCGKSYFLDYDEMK
ncbi:MAG: hypothetical protein PGN22_03095 [Agrobacterium cavarae]